MLHIHLTILISARRSATSFCFCTGQVSLPCNMPLHTQLLYSLPLIGDMSISLVIVLWHPVLSASLSSSSSSSVTALRWEPVNVHV